MLLTFNSLFDIYPDTISDGEIVIGYTSADGYLSFPFTQGFVNVKPDERGRYHSRDLDLLPISVWDRAGLNASEATQAWFGNNVCAGESEIESNGPLEEVRFADNVTRIGKRALECCFGLKSVTIPDSVTTIGDFAFRGCSGLTSISIPDSVKEIGDSAFECCAHLTEITMPNGLTRIGNYTFFCCYKLESVSIPNSVKEIGDGAFEYCGELTFITIPDSVTSIGDVAFWDCSGLTDIYVDQAESNLLAKACVPSGCTIHWNSKVSQDC